MLNLFYLEGRGSRAPPNPSLCCWGNFLFRKRFYYLYLNLKVFMFFFLWNKVPQKNYFLFNILRSLTPRLADACNSVTDCLKLLQQQKITVFEIRTLNTIFYCLNQLLSLAYSHSHQASPTNIVGMLLIWIGHYRATCCSMRCHIR